MHTIVQWEVQADCTPKASLVHLSHRLIQMMQESRLNKALEVEKYPLIQEELSPLYALDEYMQLIE